jgi:RHS repeat-associated protein
MLSSTSANVAITDRRVENAYDALGRRVRKTVKFASTGAVIEDRYFIYDGWNVIEETIAPATGPVETAEAVWGTDLSGTAQGAGGVGGLLLRESSANGASYYHYDGNGNVTALTSAAGTIQAAYTYGPFGETLRAAGPLAQANPWRFSTKYQDDETGLLYYGYRFYNPTDGRWLSRDPIEEDGGVNLYALVSNHAIGKIDVLGLQWMISRQNGEKRASARASDKSDTFDDLAKQLSLDTSDYMIWAQTFDLKVQPCKEYSVPNTIFIDLAFKDYSFWTGDHGLALVNVNHKKARKVKTKYENKGFHVVLTELAIKNDILRHLSDGDAYGYWFSGHGTDRTINTYIPKGFSEDDLAVWPGRYTKHGIAFMYLFSCDSAMKEFDYNKRWRYNSWESNVSKRGTFIGYIGEANFLNEIFNWVITGGKNVTHP